MIDRIRNLVIKTIAVACVLAPVALPMTAGAATITGTDKALCAGANLDVSGTCKEDKQDVEDRLNTTIKTIINILSMVVGVVAVIMIIIGGIQYVMSGGDSTKVTNAKNTILYAIVGLVVVALAQFIVRFVLSKTSSVE